MSSIDLHHTATLEQEQRRASGARLGLLIHKPRSVGGTTEAERGFDDDDRTLEQRTTPGRPPPQQHTCSPLAHSKFRPPKHGPRARPTVPPAPRRSRLTTPFRCTPNAQARAAGVPRAVAMGRRGGGASWVQCIPKDGTPVVARCRSEAPRPRFGPRAALKYVRAPPSKDTRARDGRGAGPMDLGRFGTTAMGASTTTGLADGWGRPRAARRRAGEQQAKATGPSPARRHWPPGAGGGAAPIGRRRDGRASVLGRRERPWSGCSAAADGSAGSLPRLLPTAAFVLDGTAAHQVPRLAKWSICQAAFRRPPLLGTVRRSCRGRRL